MNRHPHRSSTVGVQRLTLALVAAIVVAAPARAQDAVVVEPPAHVSLVEGTVVLERDGRLESSPTSVPLLSGDRLRARNGRAEVLFADGSTLHLDSDTTVDFQSDEVMRLLEGRIRLNITGTTRDVAYRIDAPSGWVAIDQPGAYRVSLLGGDREPELELAVVRGAAEIVNDDGRTLLRAGERAFARAGLAPSIPYVFNSAAWDVFDQWSEARRAERLGAAAEYLPEEVRPYAATLVEYGAWRHEPSYGYVWYPRVQAGWRPYYHGRWSHYRPWGWTWIGADPWAWPTHHYGRWGFSAGLWFWIPGIHWGPAWVSWGYAPGYVSWCPLGWNNRPVFYFNANYHHGGHHYGPWHAWTVVPHRRFGTGFVNANVVNVNNIDARTRGAFVVRPSGPDTGRYAVPRSAAPIRVAGTRAPGGIPASSVSATAPVRSVPADAGAALRSRRPAGEPLSGSGFPSAAREPRSSATLRTSPSTTSTPARGRASSATASETADRPRAAPRSGASPSTSRSDTPSRRAAPSIAPPDPQAGIQRAVPRSERSVSPPTSYDSPTRRPSREYRATPPPERIVPSDRAPYRPSDRFGNPGNSGSLGNSGNGTSGYGVPRAVPRAAPDSYGGPHAYRPSPGGGERRAPDAHPNGPPASAAPSRPSGPPPSAAPPPNRGGGDNGSRSRGSQPSRGTAVSRSRG